ncbi:30S ribosomal protein S2 [Bienertia sinuspersici]
MRDHTGEVVAPTCDQVEGVNEVDIAEALAARHALKIALEAGLWEVNLKMDCIKLFNHLNEKIKEASYFRQIVADILRLAENCRAITFLHTRRSGSVVARQLAKLSDSFIEMRVWLEEASPQIQEFVISDIIGMNE